MINSSKAFGGPRLGSRSVPGPAPRSRRSRGWVFAWPTVKAIVGNKIAPWYADWVLSRNGYEGQMTSEPEDPGRKNNLWEPLPGDHGAHGTFDDKARSFSVVTWASLHKGAVAASLLLFAGALFLINR